MRPGYPDVLMMESRAEVAIATMSLGITQQDPELWEQSSLAYNEGSAMVGYEGEEVAIVVTSLLDVGSLNSVNFTASKRVRGEANAISSFLRRRADILRLSDHASRLLNEYVVHPGYSANDEALALKAVVAQLQARQPINRLFGNKR